MAGVCASAAIKLALFGAIRGCAPIGVFHRLRGEYQRRPSTCWRLALVRIAGCLTDPRPVSDESTIIRAEPAATRAAVLSRMSCLRLNMASAVG